MKRIKIFTEQDYTDCQDFALHDFPDLRGNYWLNVSDLDARFTRTSEIKIGSRVVYVDARGHMIHFGLGTARGTILSKMGTGGKIYEHSIEDVVYPFKQLAIYHAPLNEEFDEFIKEKLR